MSVIAIALAAALTCQVPSDHKIAGLWESTTTSEGGIGGNYEFKADGSYTATTTVIVDANYDVKDGSLYMSSGLNAAIDYKEGQKVKVTESGYTQIGPDGTSVTLTKETPTADKTIVGIYKYQHPAGGTAYQKFTSDGITKFRLPIVTVGSGCYSTDKNVITMTSTVGSGEVMSYQISNNLLNLNSSKEEHSYKIVPEGAWYKSNALDQQKPAEKGAVLHY